MTGAEQLIQRGIKLGQCNMLSEQLACKFGKIPSMYQNRIQKADTTQLSEWSRKILTAKSLHQVFAEGLIK